MMKYTVHKMPDGSVEVLQTDGGEEVLGRLRFRNRTELNDCFESLGVDGREPFYIDYWHPGGKYLSANEPLSSRGETAGNSETTTGE